MDITLIRTFLEVAATGSFVNAADRLFVTQSAVSLRIQRLEDQIGRPLFTRSKAGAEMTSAGREFERYALSLIKIWEEARQQVAIPEGYTESLSIGAQYSLWPRLGFRWIDALRAARPSLNIRAELGMPDRLTRFLIEGVIQAGLLYTPQMRPGLVVEQVMEEDLVLACTDKDASMTDIAPHYVMVDWGPEFVQAHATALPDLTNPGLTFKLGAQTADFIVNRRGAAYLPARYARKYLDIGKLHLVHDAPVFPYPVWMVLREDLPTEIYEAARDTMKRVADAAQAAQDEVVDALEEAHGEEPEVLG